jgi:hypothetical protein
MVRYYGVENAISKCIDAITSTPMQGSHEVQTTTLIAYVTFSSFKAVMSCSIPCHPSLLTHS